MPCELHLSMSDLFETQRNAQVDAPPTVGLPNGGCRCSTESVILWTLSTCAGGSGQLGSTPSIGNVLQVSFCLVSRFSNWANITIEVLPSVVCSTLIWGGKERKTYPNHPNFNSNHTRAIGRETGSILIRPSTMTFWPICYAFLRISIICGALEVPCRGASIPLHCYHGRILQADRSRAT